MSRIKLMNSEIERLSRIPVLVMSFCIFNLLAYLAVVYNFVDFLTGYAWVATLLWIGVNLTAIVWFIVELFYAIKTVWIRWEISKNDK